MALCGSKACFKHAISTNRYKFDNNIAKYAVLGENLEIIHILEQRGISFNHVLRFTRDPDIAKWLLDRWENTVDALVSVCKDPKRWSWAPHLLKRLLSKPDEVNFNSRASDVCFAACTHGSFFLVKHLIEAYKFNPESKDENGKTPLHKASEYDHLDIVKLKYLIEECHCKPDETTLCCAIRCGVLAIVKYLVEECHCKPKEKDNYDRTPLHLASKYGHLDIVKYLVEKCGVTIDDEMITAANSRGVENIKDYLLEQQKKKESSRKKKLIIITI